MVAFSLPAQLHSFPASFPIPPIPHHWVYTRGTALPLCRNSSMRTPGFQPFVNQKADNHGRQKDRKAENDNDFPLCKNPMV